MKKRKLLVTVSMVAMLLLAGCGKFTCDLCGEEKSGKSYTSEILGKKITMCKDCHKELGELKDGLSGLADSLTGGK
mgnify:FL=1